MIVRAIDQNGDWKFGKGKNDYLSKNKAIIQSINTRLNSYLGDCFFALDAGIDWFNLIGSKNRLALELAVRAVILNTPNVTRLIDVSVVLNHTTRRITMSYTVETSYSSASTKKKPVSVVTSYLLTEEGLVMTTEDGSPLIAG